LGFHYYLAPAAGQEWGLTFDSVTRAIQDRWPAARIVPSGSKLAGPSLYFRLEEGGEPRIGTYFPPPRESVVLDDHDVDVVPRIFAWFIGIAPMKVSSVTFSEMAPDPLTVPTENVEEALQAIYTA
jgi:hypothetical protein